MSIELMSYHTPQGFKTVLVDNDGRKWMQVLMMDGNLVVKKVSNEETRYMKPCVGKTKAMSTLVKQYRSFGKKNGMSKAAKTFLTKANKAA